MKLLYLLLFSFLTATNAIPVVAVEKATSDRLDEVERIGKHVMPFDLNQTLHVFSKTEKGGVQQVISKLPSDTNQITLIRDHLKEIATKFKKGDFTGPTKVHGKNMPGLNELKNAEPGLIDIQYRELTNGAEITYSTKNQTLISAIHQWFDAQLSDHARHATGNHDQHMMHK
ncbi:MAG: aspartate carbamoyltransferase [Methylococcaceae bacterium]|nr:aspartate carbamoyltransferase [Methylococcaceae bacterium]